mmetsp:Transcript_6182/g.15303  ORF Transcript_6182/g.15303 Transcript_6182/m.15303 type:complete len:184 (-) Transcript_6182:252-803(-)
MINSSKTTMVHDESIPLVQASLLAIDAESFRSVQTEYVVIDEYYDDVHTSDHFLEESSNSAHFQAASDTPNIDPANSTWDHEHTQDFNRVATTSTTASFPCSKANQSKTNGAWVGGTVLGFLMGAGPSISIAFGVGVAYCSQQDEGVVGDIARAIGDIAILSHTKFVEVNEKHNLIETVVWWK